MKILLLASYAMMIAFAITEAKINDPVVTVNDYACLDVTSIMKLWKQRLSKPTNKCNTPSSFSPGQSGNQQLWQSNVLLPRYPHDGRGTTNNLLFSFSPWGFGTMIIDAHPALLQMVVCYVFSYYSFRNRIMMKWKSSARKQNKLWRRYIPSRAIIYISIWSVPPSPKKNFYSYSISCLSCNNFLCHQSANLIYTRIYLVIHCKQ